MTPIFSTMPIALSGGTTLASVLALVLSVVLWVGLSIFIGWTLSKVMHNQGMKTKPVFIMVISAVFSILLIARYGLSITAIQGLFLLYVLVYASCSDLTTHTVEDWLWRIPSRWMEGNWRLFDWSCIGSDCYEYLQ